MGVGSFLEMYTTILAWRVYGIIWDGITVTGIILLPYIIIILSSIPKVFASLASVGAEDESDDVITELVTLAIKLFLAFLVMIFFLVPTVNLSTSVISYVPRPTLVDETPDAANPTSDGDPTTLHSSFNTVDNFFDDIELPLAWNLITRGSSGFTFGVVNGLGRPMDLEESLANLTTTAISDQTLQNEVSDFYRSCYTPARAKLSVWLTSQNITPALRTRIEQADEGDLNYFGSTILLDTEGLYAQCNDLNQCQGSLRSPRPVMGFPFRATRDQGYSELDIANEVPGMPYCDEWWTSIMERILAEEPAAVASTWESFRSFWGSDATEARIERVRIQRVLSNTDIRASSLLGDIPGSAIEAGNQERTDSNGLALAGGAGVATLGARAAGAIPQVRGAAALLVGAEVAFTGASAYQNFRKMSYVKRAVPITISILLFVIPLIIPFALLWGLYSFGTAVTLAITYFSIRFLSALFEIGVLLQSTIFMSIMGDWTDIASYVTGQGIIGGGETILVLSFIVPVIFLVIPLLFLSLAARFGVAALAAVGVGFSSVNNNVNPQSGLSAVLGKFVKKK